MSLSQTFCRWRPVCCTLLLTILVVYSAVAQEARRITGTVTGANAQPLAGVAVQVKGGSTGVTTDEKGQFSIMAKKGDVLQLSSVGYQPQEITISLENQVFATLVETTKALEDVVVIGYGSQKRKLVLGATAHVGGSDLDKNHSVSPLQALQGQAAGVQITSTSGQPGDALKIRVRGVGTNGNANPLFVVDGMPTTDISYLNPADIESMDILKDAASAAIYGTNGANGVVFITTKKGKAGRKAVTFNMYYGWQNPTKKLDVLNAKEYAVIMNEAALNSGLGPNYVYSQKQIDTLGAGTDWQKAAQHKNAVQQNYTLGMSGGNDQSIYSASLGYQKQDGMIGLPGRSFYERFTFRINSDHKIYKDILRFGENLTYMHSNQSGIGTGNIYNNSLRALLNTSPMFPVYNPDGTYARSPNSEEANPIAALDYRNYNRTSYDRVFGNAYLEATIVKGLKIRSDFGLDLSYNYSKQFTPQYYLTIYDSTTTTTATMGMYRTRTWNWDNTITYQHNFGDHNLTLLVGTTAKKIDDFYVNGSKQGLTVADFYHAVINAATNNLTQKIFGSTIPYALNSYFGRLNYSYQDKYLFTAILRRDGSSNFGGNNKYAYFPSFSAGWVATNEKFLNHIDWLSFLKLRAGWGQNGNDQFARFQSLATVSSANQGYYFGGPDNQQLSVGTSPDKIANPSLKWETSEQSNIGFDATVLGHFNITFDIYNKKTKDWLIQPTVPGLVGTAAPYINGGNVSNKGLELAINYQNKIGEVVFNVGGNLALNKNRVYGIRNTSGIIEGSPNILSSSTEIFYRLQDGYPMGYFYGYKTAGVFQNMQEVNNYVGKNGLIQPGAQPGDVRFVDLNGDGVITDADKTQIGNPIPTYTYGFNLSASWKALDVSILLSGVGGNDIVDGTRSNDRWYNNYTTAVFDRWHGEGTSNRLPRLTRGTEANRNWSRFSDLYVYPGAYLRVKSVNIGYDFKKSLFRNLPVQQFRLYASGLNLLTFTKYRGVDPEVGYGNTENSGYTWSSGIDLGYYPQPRTIMLGLDVRF